MAFKNRIRLPILFYQPQFPTERNIFRKADGTSKVLSVVVRNTYDGKTDQLPEAWHRKLVIALSHDTVTIENERLLSNVVLNGDYGINWLDFLQYPIAPADFNVEVTPFNATNSNCHTCDEMSQLSLVDDFTAEVWVEGTTNEFPDVLTDNDNICCSPFTIELVTFNTEFFTAVSISAAGVLTATVINPAPIVSNILIATYRVTCPGGQYDEANVYGNITGTDTNFCFPPATFVETYISETSVLINWGDGTPSATFWNWILYLTSAPGFPIDSGGGLLVSEVTLTGLTPGANYTIIVVAYCGGAYEFSTPGEFEFTTQGGVGGNCGAFGIESIDPNPVNISFMDCSGNIINFIIPVASIVQRCMFVFDNTSTPVYFVASSPLVNLEYRSPC